MTDAPVARAKKPRGPWRGRMRVKDARKQVHRRTMHRKGARGDHRDSAEQAGLSVGAFLRALALGNAGPRAVRRPPVERKELARLVGHLGKVGSNINQLAHGFNRDRHLAGIPGARSPFARMSARCARRSSRRSAMVIKGMSCGDARRLAVHLTRTDTNERAEVMEFRGVAAEDLRGALLEMEAVAAGTPDHQAVLSRLDQYPRRRAADGRAAHVCDRPA